jgi:integrase/recombinase XerD
MQDKNSYLAFMTALPALIPDNPHPPQQAETDDQVIALWLHGRSAHTQRAYRQDICRFQAFMPKTMAELTLRDFQGFTDSLHCAASSKRRIIASLKSL